MLTLNRLHAWFWCFNCWLWTNIGLQELNLVLNVFIIDNKVSIRMLTDAEWPANIYLFKVNNRTTRKRCEICSKSKTKQQNDVTDIFLMFLLLTLNLFLVFLLLTLNNISWAVPLLLTLNTFSEVYSSSIQSSKL